MPLGREPHDVPPSAASLAALLEQVRLEVDARLARNETPDPSEWAHDDPVVEEELRSLVELRILQHQAEMEGGLPKEATLAEAEAEFHDALTRGEEPDTRRWKTEFPELTVDIDRLMARLRFLNETLQGPMEDRPPSLTVVLSEGELGEYRLVKGIAQHPLGPIYLARHARDQRLVELLAFRPDVPEYWILLAKERALSSGVLSQSSVARAIHSGEDRGVPYLVFEHQEGVPLKDILFTLRGDGVCPSEDRRRLRTLIRLVTKAARTLDSAHRSGVFHRGLCPGALVVVPPNEVRVRWFGLGTWPSELLLWDEALAPWLAPEVCRGERAIVEWRADVYGLGALLHGVCTLSPPFVNPALERAAPLAITAPSLPPALSSLIEQCLNDDPQARLATCGALAEALSALNL